jgi:hypothetical protein
LKEVELSTETSLNVSTLLSSVLKEIGIAQPLSEYVDMGALIPFNSLDKATVFSLFKDMYAPQDGEAITSIFL